MDVTWIRAVVKRFERPLTAYAVGLLGDVERAREVVQDTFLKLCDQDRKKIEPYLAQWLFTVCRNRATDVLRRDSRQSPLSDAMLKTRTAAQPRPDQIAEHKETAFQMIRLMDELPANQQEVIRLKFQGGLSYKQIAEVTGLTTSYIGWLIHTGIKTLRERLQALETRRSPLEDSGTSA